MEDKNTKTRTLIGRLWREENENGKYLSGSLDLDVLKTLTTSSVRIIISKTKEKRQETSPDALVFGYLEPKPEEETKKEKDGLL